MTHKICGTSTACHGVCHIANPAMPATQQQVVPQLLKSVISRQVNFSAEVRVLPFYISQYIGISMSSSTVRLHCVTSPGLYRPYAYRGLLQINGEYQELQSTPASENLTDSIQYKLHNITCNSIALNLKCLKLAVCVKYLEPSAPHGDGHGCYDGIGRRWITEVNLHKNL